MKKSCSEWDEVVQRVPRALGYDTNLGLIEWA